MGSTTSSTDTLVASSTKAPLATTEITLKSLEDIGQSVIAEALRAREQWGGEFDLKNTLNDWTAYINIYLAHATTMGASAEEIVRGLRKAAGLVLSALYHAENGLLAPRHYDGQERPKSLPEIQA